MLTLRGKKTPPPKVSALKQLLSGLKTMPKKALLSIGQGASSSSPNTVQISVSSIQAAVFPTTSTEAKGAPLTMGSFSTTNADTVDQGSSLRQAAMQSRDNPRKSKQLQIESIVVLPGDSTHSNSSVRTASTQTTDEDSIRQPSLETNKTRFRGKRDKQKTESQATPTKAEKNALAINSIPPGAPKEASIINTTMAPLGKSTWIANDWYPPLGGKVFDLQGIRKVFGRGNILWIGDAQFKYTYTSLLRILNSKAFHLDKVYLKRLFLTPCATDASLSSCTRFQNITLDFVTVPCFTEMRNLLSNADFSKYSAVVVEFGQEEMLGICPYSLSNKGSMFLDIALRMREVPTKVVWTTLAWTDPVVVEINRNVIEACQKDGSPNLSVFDFASGMQLRSDAIEVNMKKKKVAYTVHARQAYVQMLANHLNHLFPPDKTR